MVTDQEPRYRLVDSNGNVVGSLFAESDGTLKLQEGTSGSDNEVSVTTDGSLTTDLLSVNSQESERHYRKIGSASTASGSTLSISVSDTFQFSEKELLIRVLLDPSSNTVDGDLRFNGDSGGNGNYSFTTNDGTTTTGSDSIKLINSSGGFNFSGGQARVLSRGDRPAVGANIGATPTATNTVAQYGVRKVSEDITSVEFLTGGDANAALEVFSRSV